MAGIKTYFESRWKLNGWIIEADYSQLEVIVLAHLTKDPMLIKDLTSGVDMHRIRAADLFSKPVHEVTTEERKVAKAFSFQLQYGSGARNMADKTGMPLHLAEQFIQNYYRRYKKVKEWQDNNIAKVKATRRSTGEKSKSGYPIGLGYLKSETGRVYRFKEGDSPDFMKKKGIYTSFKPTEIKNYPVQGLATGDIVPMMLGKINRWIVSNNWINSVKLVNTVHDSIVLDVEDSMVYTIGIGLKEVMEKAGEYYQENFGIEFILPLKVEVEVGQNWGELVPFDEWLTARGV